MSLATTHLAIDSKRVIIKIEEHIQQIVDANMAQGVILGLSGGLDSAVLAALTVRALGNSRVNVYYLYDRDSSKESLQKAQSAANSLGLQLQIKNIEPAMKQRGIYKPLIMRINALSGFFNRLLTNTYHFFYGEPAFASTLQKDNRYHSKTGKFFYNHTVRHVEEAFNARHIYRRQFLEKLAKERSCILLGAANRTEYLLGWFVKDGIDDLPFSPLVGLYKTQVRQLASFLDLPSEIQNQAASPDMIKGITDEFAIGISYPVIDIILYGIEQGLSDEKIVKTGASENQICKVRRMIQSSEWKRN